MNQKCSRCNSEIPKLDFPHKELEDILAISKKMSKVHAVKKLINQLGFNHYKAKVIIAHLNIETGKCTNCNYNPLIGKNIECPKCKAFNYNI
jgi:hypothetical protein